MEATIFRNIVDINNPHYLSVEKLLDRIKTGKSKDIVERIRATESKDERNRLKMHLPSVCWSGKFSRRANSAILEQTKLIILDFDNLERPKDKKVELSQSKYCFSAWLSPTGTGVKMLVKVASADHAAHFLALQQDFPDIDASGKDLARVCYESYDPDIFINPSPEIYSKTHQPKQSAAPKQNTNEDTYEKLKTWLISQGQAFVEGNRNNFITRLAAACNRTGIPRDEAKYLIFSDFVAKDASFSESELERTLNGIYERYSSNHGSFAFKNDRLTDSKGIELTRENFDDGKPPKDIIYALDVKSELEDEMINGIKEGNTTFFPEIDEKFKWLKGQLTVMNGFGNYGKSTFHTHLCLIRSVLAGDKWCVFSPEQSPAKMFYRDIIQQHTGKTFTKGLPNTITRKEMNDSLEFIHEKFFLVEPQNDAPSPEYMIERFFEMIIKKGVDGCVIDPFNQLANHWDKFSGRDLYLEKYLNTFKQFAKANNIYLTIIAHPKTPGRDNKNEAPDVFSLSGGTMWNNKADNILCYHRPNRHLDPADPSCTFISQKIRFQQVVGRPGDVDMVYDYKTFRFYINGKNPLEKSNQFPAAQSKIMPNENFDTDIF